MLHAFALSLYFALLIGAVIWLVGIPAIIAVPLFGIPLGIAIRRMSATSRNT